jgi:glycosyltransferase involved in cell wall biosynthesis
MNISVIIPTLNEEKYIGTLLDSLVDQTSVDFEVIVVDAKSTDNTKEVVSKYFDKLDLRFVASPQKGVSFQRNYGAELSKYDYVMFIDADGYIKPNFLEKIEGYVNRNPKIDLFSAWILPLSKKRAYTTLFYVYNIMFIEAMKKIKPFISIGGFLFVKKSVFNALGGYSVNHAYLEDADLVERAFKKSYKIDFIRKPAVYTSVRRLEKDGLPKLLYNVLKAEFYKHTTAGDIDQELMEKKKIKYDMNGGSDYEVE